MASQKSYTLLIVDDEELVHQALKICLPAPWKVVAFDNLESIQWDRLYHAAFIDMHLSAHSTVPDGPSIIEKLSKLNPQLEVIAMSGDLNRSLMESCLKAGASRFLAKPLNPDEVQLIIKKIEALWEMRSFDGTNRKTKWIGTSEESQAITKKIANLRGESSIVLIEGETGTGKEVAARLLHEQENEGPFISVNIGSITENLFESELFGHIRGAFTGAESNKIGLAEAAHGGDLFLDEIEALPLTQQVKLLRFLETGEIRKVGSKDTQYVKTRVIAASNRSLLEMVKKGEFREDLYYRLGNHVINLPALRHRKEDVSQLAKFFLAAQRPKRLKTFSEDGLLALKQYAWPGNVRELKRVCEQLSLTAPLPIIRAEDVQRLLLVAVPDISVANIDDIDLSRGLGSLTDEFEKKIIEKALEKAKTTEETAKLLQISRSNLYKKIQSYNLNVKES